MRKLLILTLNFAFLLLLSSCRTDAVITTELDKVLTLDLSAVTFTGELRVGVSSDFENLDNLNTSSIPRLLIPVSNPLNTDLFFTDAGTDMPEGLSVETYCRLDPTTVGPLEILIEGTPVTAGEDTLYVNVYYQGVPNLMEIPVYILDTYESITELDIQKVEVEAQIYNGLDVLPNEQGSKRLAVTYTEGWGRVVDFSIASPKSLRLTEATSTGVALSGGSYEKTVYLNIEGDYNDVTNDFSLVLLASATDGSNVTYTKALTALTPEEFTFDLVEDYGLTVNKVVGGNKNLVVDYQNGLGRTVYVSAKSSDSGIALSAPTSIDLEEGDGQFEIGLLGAPTQGVGDEVFSATVSISGQGIDGTITKTLYSDIVGDLIITGVSIDVPFGAHTRETQTNLTSTVIVNYENAKVGKTLALSQVSGFMTAFGTAGISEVVTLESETGSVQYTIEADDWHSEDFTGVSFPAAAEFVLDINYNGSIVEGSEANSIARVDNVYGFIWEGKAYYEITDDLYAATGGWLDRNVGAINAVMPIGTDGYMVSDAKWSDSYYDAFGVYMPRGASTGIPLYSPNREGYDESALPEGHEGYPYFLSGIGAYSDVDEAQALWAQGYWVPAGQVIGTTYTAGSTYSTEHYELWTLADGDGGTNNPCPKGYRVPIGTEISAVMNVIYADTARYIARDNLRDQAMASEMRLAPTGQISSGGPSSAGMSTSYGQVGVPGMLTVGTSTSFGSVISTEDASLRFLYSDIRNAAAATYVQYYTFSSTTLTVPTRSYINYQTSFTVRCIKVTTY